ncbi:hypothetical protein [Chitinophaga skermanii]|nr:hypothetical protein [Chitinophaga skermanii]
MEDIVPNFDNDTLSLLLKKGYKYFVRQQVNSSSIKTFLFTPYTQWVFAQQHYTYIASDRYKYLYNVDNSFEMENLLKAANKPDGFKILLGIIKKDVTISTELQQKLIQSIQPKIVLPSIVPPKIISFAINLHFGEIIYEVQTSVGKVKFKYKDGQFIHVVK